MKSLFRRGSPFAVSLMLAASITLAGIPAVAQSAAGHPDWPGMGQLFVGTCYQPVARTPEEIHRDIAIMKKAGFTLVRMGDLSWDSFEPSEDHFEFAWFDKVMDEMAASGIKVILDIPGSPVHEDPCHPITAAGKRLVKEKPDTEIGIAWWPPALRSGRGRLCHGGKRPAAGQRRRHPAADSSSPVRSAGAAQRGRRQGETAACDIRGIVHVNSVGCARRVDCRICRVRAIITINCQQRGDARQTAGNIGRTRPADIERVVE